MALDQVLSSVVPMMLSSQVPGALLLPMKQFPLRALPLVAPMLAGAGAQTPRRDHLGLGLVSPWAWRGAGLAASPQAGQSGIRGLDAAVCDGIDTHIGRVGVWKKTPKGAGTPMPWCRPRPSGAWTPATSFALGAADQALAQAGWHPQDEVARQRTATVWVIRHWRLRGDCRRRAHHRHPGTGAVVLLRCRRFW